MSDELQQSNFWRICIINWLLVGPVLLLFGLPYYVVAKNVLGNHYLWLPGSLLFAMPFMLTVLHGHVTIAVGRAHRNHYYEWLENRPFSAGLGYHPMLLTTRFRFGMILMALLLLVLG